MFSQSTAMLLVVNIMAAIAYLIVAAPFSISTIAAGGCIDMPPFSAAAAILLEPSFPGGAGNMDEDDEDASLRAIWWENALRGLTAFQRAMMASGKIGTKPMHTAMVIRALLRMWCWSCSVPRNPNCFAGGDSLWMFITTCMHVMCGSPATPSGSSI
jgi:hypothetical protein